MPTITKQPKMYESWQQNMKDTESEKCTTSSGGKHIATLAIDDEKDVNATAELRMVVPGIPMICNDSRVYHRAAVVEKRTKKGKPRMQSVKDRPNFIPTYSDRMSRDPALKWIQDITRVEPFKLTPDMIEELASLVNAQCIFVDCHDHEDFRVFGKK